MTRVPALADVRRWITWIALPVLAAACAVAPPQALADDDARSDPPARVGAVTAIQGDVQLASEPGAAWERAQINWPVSTGTTLFVPPGGRAELRIGSTSVRFDGDTQVEFSQLDDHGITLETMQGTVRARVRALPTGDLFSIASDGVRAQALQPGDYRASYDPDRRSYTVGVISGRLRLVTPTNSVDVAPGQEITTERGGATLSLAALSLRGDFDAWSEARDRLQDRAVSNAYVSPEMTGAEVLADHGSWVRDTAYGSVWYPAVVPVGWAPYRYGRWAWIAPWGWTWVDDAPWGYAPFHYGRWAMIGGRWGWCPGGYVARPVWAPALVGFVGGRSGNVNWGVSIGSAAPVGWFPLAPQEAYRPPYRHTTRYVQQVNIFNNTNIVVNPRDRDRRAYRHNDGHDGAPPRDSYRYAQRPEALTVVSEDRFRSSRPIGRDHVRLDDHQVAQLQPVAATLPAYGGAGAVRPVLPSQARDERANRPTTTLPTPIRVPQRDGRDGRDDDNAPRPGRGGTPGALPWVANPAVPRPLTPVPQHRDPDRDDDNDARPGRQPGMPAVRPTPAMPPAATLPQAPRQDGQPARAPTQTPATRPTDPGRDHDGGQRPGRGHLPAWMTGKHDQPQPPARPPMQQAQPQAPMPTQQPAQQPARQPGHPPVQLKPPRDFEGSPSRAQPAQQPSMPQHPAVQAPRPQQPTATPAPAPRAPAAARPEQPSVRNIFEGQQRGGRDDR